MQGSFILDSLLTKVRVFYFGFLAFSSSHERNLRFIYFEAGY